MPATRSSGSRSASPDRTAPTSPASPPAIAASARTPTLPRCSSTSPPEDIGSPQILLRLDAPRRRGRLPGRLSREARKLPVSINVSLGTNGHAHDVSSAINRWIDAVRQRAGPSASPSPPATPARRGRTRSTGRLRLAHGPDPHQRPDSEGRSRRRARVGGRGQRIARHLRERIRALVRRRRTASPSRCVRRAWTGSRTIEPRPVHREPPASRRQLHQHLQRAVSPRQRRQLHLHLPEPAAVAAGRHRRARRAPGGAHARQGSARWQLSRLDRARRSAARSARSGPQELWRFPSFFSERSTSTTPRSARSPAASASSPSPTSTRPASAINISSSQGPTRDGRFKPDVAAPGTDIVAAKGFAGPNDLWVAMTGTSMASPLRGRRRRADARGRSRDLTAAQIGGILQRTSRPLPGDDYNWRNDAGFGVHRCRRLPSRRRPSSINQRRTDRT